MEAITQHRIRKIWILNEFVVSLYVEYVTSSKWWIPSSLETKLNQQSADYPTKGSSREDYLYIRVHKSAQMPLIQLTTVFWMDFSSIFQDKMLLHFSYHCWWSKIQCYYYCLPISLSLSLFLFHLHLPFVQFNPCFNQLYCRISIPFSHVRSF